MQTYELLVFGQRFLCYQFVKEFLLCQMLTQLVPSADPTPVNCGIGFLVVHYIFFYCLLGLGAASCLIDLLYLADGFGWLSQVDVFFVGG